MSQKYLQKDNSYVMDTAEGPAQLTNFVCQIDKEVVFHDGNKTETHLEISGRLNDTDEDNPEGSPLPTITIPAADFASMSWVAEKWGMVPIIYPQSSSERHLRTAIQVHSKPKREHVYTHTGWSDLGKENGYAAVYLSASGGISAKGLDSGIRVQLPNELRHYDLPAPQASRDAFTDSFTLRNLGPKHVLWPMLLATYRAAIGGTDFVVHLAGRTGTYKSEISSLMQSHFGARMDARHLPAAWSGTANSVEALAYRAKDAIMVIDDFVPVGTAYQVRQLQSTADRIIRAAGNQAGRSRLTDVSSMQTTMFPRCLVLSTGEDVYDGHSIRGRSFILELTPGDIETPKLTEAQRRRESLPQAMSDWIHWLAESGSRDVFRSMAAAERDKHLGVGHTRTPAMIGGLIATARLIFEYGVARKYYSVEVMSKLIDEAEKHVIEAAKRQKEFIETSDPVNAVKDTIRLLLTSHMAHVKTQNGGIPEDADRYGWTKINKPGELINYKSEGPRLGWIDSEDDLLMLDPGTLTLIKKHSGGKLAVTPQTLLKRMKESGMLTRIDDARQRNTVRCQCEGHQRQVLCMSLSDVMEAAGDE